MRREIARDARGHSLRPSECTICDDHVTRSKPSSGKQRRSEKPAAPPPKIDGARALQRDAARGRVSRRTAVVAAVIAAATIAAGGLAFQFLTGWRSASSAGSSATTAAAFVGSETCAGCHQAEAPLEDAERQPVRN